MYSAKLADYRDQFRREHIPSYYCGVCHFVGVVAIAVGLIALCVSQLENLRAVEWLTIPIALVYANLVEYFGHRYPMHHRVVGLGLVFERHTAQHHRFFNHDAMSFDSDRDFKAVLFPLMMISFYFVGIGIPTFLLVAWLFSSNIAWLFVATAVAYYFNYEMLHFAYHTARDSWVAKIPGMRTLRRLHTLHHDPQLMQSYNFNITYPLGDWLFGTLYRAELVGEAELAQAAAGHSHANVPATNRQ